VYVDRELGIRAARSDRHLDVIRVRGAPSDLPLRVLVILDNPEVHRLARLAVDDHRNVAGDTRRTVSEADVVLGGQWQYLYTTDKNNISFAGPSAKLMLFLSVVYRYCH